MSDVCTDLPRTNCTVVRFIRHYVDKENVNECKYEGFIIRKKKVMDALFWLKRFNPLYRDDESVTINASNLSWMGDSDECQLNDIITVNDNKHISDEEDCTVSKHQTGVKPNMEYGGTSVEKVKVCHQYDDKMTVSELIRAVKKSGQTIPNMDFPQIKLDPIDEYSGISLFCGAFPWLFPGGVGDVIDDSGEQKQDLNRWLERLMRYKDYRFERDKMFAFYANDYCQRKMANSNAGFFVKRVCGDCPSSLDDLTEQIENGNFKFIHKLLYFSGALKGSDAYWRRKKEELNEWILYHIHHDHGPPTLFVTLSCAELWWPDLKRLLAERLNSFGTKTYDELATKMLDGDHKSSMKAVNLFTTLVQEYFHKRVEEWLDTVGRKILKIKHYWGAYEFASGRGQIHIHMLAITEDQLHNLHQYYTLKNDSLCVQKRVKLMSDYARNVLELTADHPGYMTEKDYKEDDINRENYMPALQKRYVETKDDIMDQKNLCHCVQLHHCNDFCLRTKSSKCCRSCRIGAG